jgi:hypothetical protein
MHVPKLRLINPRNPLNHLVENDVARRVTFGRAGARPPKPAAAHGNLEGLTTKKLFQNPFRTSATRRTQRSAAASSWNA